MIKSLQRMPILINYFKAPPNLPDHLQAGEMAAMRISTDCCANTFQRIDPCPRSLIRKFELFKTIAEVFHQSLKLVALRT
jgi:hypothetical protein